MYLAWLICRPKEDYLSLLLDRDDVKKRFEDLQRLVDAPSLRIAGKTDANGRESTSHLYFYLDYVY